jgi:ABC-2 type transport system ATP-binding protein
MIEVEHLQKVYGSTTALQDVTFEVQPGEILGLLGPNGAGKTTTMRILAGYLPATSGTVRVAGYEVHEQPMAVRRRIGYLPENPPLYPNMTVEGFLSFVAQIKGVPAGDRSQKIAAALQRCHLGEHRRTLIRKLSKGFQQRVGIAQAIVHAPPVIILDEPTVGLDPRQIIEMRELIKDLAGRHTVILSTHILPEVSMTCNQVAIINHGHVVTTGSLEELMVQLKGDSGYELEVEGSLERVQSLLLTLPGVERVEPLMDTPLPDNRLKIRVLSQPDLELGRELTAALTEAGIGLYELRSARASLEDIFLTLTTLEQETPEPGQGSGGERMQQQPFQGERTE